MDLRACCLTLLSLVLGVASFEPFNDKVRFDINWAGPVTLREGQVTQVSFKSLKGHASLQCNLLPLYSTLYDS